MKFKGKMEIEKGRLDIAPLVDVIFLLIIFFMLTSSFISQPGIKINLPRAVTSEVLQERDLVITITKENIIYLNDRITTQKELGEKLAAVSSQQVPVLIKADRGTSLGRIVEIWDLCREKGVAHINIATQQEVRD